MARIGRINGDREQPAERARDGLTVRRSRARTSDHQDQHRPAGEPRHASTVRPRLQAGDHGTMTESPGLRVMF